MGRAAVCVVRMCVGLAQVALPLLPAGSAQAQPTATAGLAGWLFDNYVEQQIEAAAKRALGRDPSIAAGILRNKVALTGALVRHRAVFEASIAPAIDANFKTDEIARLETVLREITAGREAGLSEAQRQGLTALDSDFRRNAQTVIRAVCVPLSWSRRFIALASLTGWPQTSPPRTPTEPIPPRWSGFYARQAWPFASIASARAALPILLLPSTRDCP